MSTLDTIPAAAELQAHRAGRFHFDGGTRILSFAAWPDSDIEGGYRLLTSLMSSPRFRGQAFALLWEIAECLAEEADRRRDSVAEVLTP